jgi:hypothetical protein
VSGISEESQSTTIDLNVELFAIESSYREGSASAVENRTRFDRRRVIRIGKFGDTPRKIEAQRVERISFRNFRQG